MTDTLRCAYSRQCAVRHTEFTDDGATEANISTVARWLTTGGKRRDSLLLYGGVGNGKSTMLFAVQAALRSLKGEADRLATEVRYGRQPMDTDGRKSLQAVMDALDTTVLHITAPSAVRLNAADMPTFNYYANCGLLLLDDLGRESLAVRHYGTELFPIIDLLCRRYDMMLPTIATSNLTDKELAETYGERVADRIEEFFDKVAYTNKSYRR